MLAYTEGNINSGNKKPMEYNIEVRAFRYTGELDDTGYPEEVEVFQGRKICDPEFDSTFDQMDDFKMKLSDAVEKDLAENADEGSHYENDADDQYKRIRERELF